jgi:hypothetical protein
MRDNDFRFHSRKYTGSISCIELLSYSETLQRLKLSRGRKTNGCSNSCFQRSCYIERLTQLLDVELTRDQLNREETFDGEAFHMTTLARYS